MKCKVCLHDRLHRGQVGLLSCLIVASAFASDHTVNLSLNDLTRTWQRSEVQIGTCLFGSTFG